MRMTKKPHLLIIEFNEFNVDLLKKGARFLCLKNIGRLISLKQTETLTDDTYESGFLEPWSQWVSIHTGKTSRDHQIKHLGDVPHLEHKQLWEKLSEMSVTTGVWGPMNASRKNAPGCLFFLPDPWTFTEHAFPEEINPVLELLRYSAQNYLKFSKLELIKKTWRFLKYIYSVGLMGKVARVFPQLILASVRFKFENFIFITFFDYVSALLFLKYRQKYRPEVTIFFMNSIAHLQHHHWHGDDLRKNKRMTYGLRVIDQILGLLFADAGKDEYLLVTNGLSQVNTNLEKNWILYRQKDQTKFLKAAGIKFREVHPHMTYDAHILFDTEKECLLASEVLRKATLGSHKIFLVELYPDAPTKLFYRVDFSDEISTDTFFQINGRKLRFFDFLTAIVKRTGKHIPSGAVFTDLPHIKSSIKNSEIYEVVLETFRPAEALF